MMSVRMPTLSPSLTNPIAMPATGAVSGTPASMSAMEAPQMLAIDDEPLDSRMSDTTRTVYGNTSRAGITASIARWASAPWPISRRPGVPKRFDLARGERGEVVVEHEAAEDVALERLQLLLVILGAERRRHERLRLAPGKERGAVDARQIADLGPDGAYLGHPAAVQADSPSPRSGDGLRPSRPCRPPRAPSGAGPRPRQAWPTLPRTRLRGPAHAPASRGSRAP